MDAFLLLLLLLLLLLPRVTRRRVTSRVATRAGRVLTIVNACSQRAGIIYIRWRLSFGLSSGFSDKIALRKVCNGRTRVCDKKLYSRM